jgi:hypothetical protein
LSEVFIRSDDAELLKKAIFILEQIFPKVSWRWNDFCNHDVY